MKPAHNTINILAPTSSEVVNLLDKRHDVPDFKLIKPTH
jgi:hypothetical protein